MVSFIKENRGKPDLVKRQYGDDFSSHNQQVHTPEIDENALDELCRA